MSRGARILIVDDLEENIEVLVRLLERAGYNTVSTTDPCAAVDLVRESAPDLMVLDLEMPAMTGLEVMTAVREATAEGEFMPVLMLTGTTSPDAEWMSLAHGAGDFVRKPFRGAELLLRVKNLLERGMTSRALSGYKANEVTTPEPEESLAAGPAPSSFVRKVGHDLNNLLTQICGYADLLALDSEPDSRTREDVAEIQRAAQDASRLTAELLAYGQPSGADVGSPGDGSR